MKILSKIRKTALRLFALVALAAPMMVSCYDDSDLQAKVDMLVDKVFALEEQLNAEISTLKALLRGQLFISDVTTDGDVTNVVLSDSTVLKLLPQQNLKSLVTYITLSDGTQCWAYIDANGQKQLFLDEQNHPIPVLSETPEIVVRDGETWIIIGGSEYPLSGNSVFSDYELITDEDTGEVLAVTFTFGETMSFTVTVNSAQGFWFVKENGEDVVKYDSYFVNVGETVRVQVKSKGVDDYVVQLPEGWKYKEVEDKVTANQYFDISAPSADALSAGAASEGNLKVLAALEGGKASAARLYLTTSPFKTLNVSYGKLTVERYPGLEKYVYGISTAADYDKAEVMASVKGLKDTAVYPEGAVVTDADIIDMKIEDLAKVSLVVGTEYVVWAIPMTKGADAYLPIENVIVECAFTHSNIDLSILDPGFLDATLKMDLAGLDAYYVGLETKDKFDEEVIVAGLNAGKYTAKSTPMTYEGSVFTFTGVPADHSTEYIFWFTVAGGSKTYTSDDMIVVPFKTATFASGGTASVTVDETSVVSTPTTVSASISAEGANMIFYTYLKATDKKLSGSDEDLVNHLLKNGVQVNLSEVVAGTDDEGVALKLKDETDVVLVALAVDADGKYGSLLKYDCSTSVLTYNDAVVTIDVLRQDPDNVVLKMSATGNDIVDYIYWVGSVSNNFWISPNYLAGTEESASKFFALDMNNYRFVDMKTKYPMDSDGVVTLTDLVAGSNYVAVCVAVDKNGMTSLAGVTKFNVYQFSIGNVVKSTDPKWEAARPTVEWIEEKFVAAAGQMSGAYGFYVSIPVGFSAYVLAGTDSYLNLGDATLEMTPEDRILSIIEYVDKPRDWHLTTSEDWTWPHIGYEHYHSEHGAPLWGNSVIWASQEYHDSVCDCGGNYEVEKDMQGHKVTVTHQVNINGEGKKFEFRQPQAIGSTSEVIDKVFVVCFDLEGNCYQDFAIDVPVEIFQNAGARDE